MKDSASSPEISEPIRLLQGGGSPHERRLLESAALDVMPSSTPERLARALARPAASVPLASRRWTRLGALGGVGVVGVVAALAFGRPAAPPPTVVLAPWPAGAVPAAVAARAPSEASAPGSESTPTRAPGPPASEAAGAGLDERAQRDVVGDGRRRPRPRVTAPATAPRATPAAASGAGLVDEVRLLEQARTALRAGKNLEAERALADYRAQFSHGELAFEADLLEAERAHADGDSRQAQRLARQLLGRTGAERYRQRLERLATASARAKAPALGSDHGDANMEGRRSNP